MILVVVDNTVSMPRGSLVKEDMEGLGLASFIIFLKPVPKLMEYPNQC